MVRERDPVTGRFKRGKEKQDTQRGDQEGQEDEQTKTHTTMDQGSFAEMMGLLRAQNETYLAQMKEMMENFRNPKEQSLKPSEIYLFKPTSRQDERSARIFIERIRDAQELYKTQLPKLVTVLPRCLDNEVAHAWYSALADSDRTLLAQAPAYWLTVIKRDFMGTDAQLRSAADKESFRWNQGRSPAEYVDEKVGKLRLAGITNDIDLVQRVYEGFLATPDLQAALAAYVRADLQAFRQYLREVQDIYRRLHERQTPKQKESRNYCEQYTYPSDWQRSAYSSTPRSSDHPPVNQHSVEKNESSKPKSISADKHFNTKPPYPCRRCSKQGQKADHWMAEYPLRNEKKAFAGQEDSSDDEKQDKSYHRLQQGYLTM